MERHSLVLITVDCLRADHVGFLGYHRSTTPFLDNLAPGSCVFKQAVVTGSPTYYSFPGIMASRYPLALGRDVIGVSPHESTLATCLKQNGYRTAAFVAGNPYLTRRFGYDTGFDHFEDFLDSKIGDEPSPVRRSFSRATRLNQRIAGACHRVGPLGAAYDEAYFRYTSWKGLQRRKSIDELRPYPPASKIVDRACTWLEETNDQPFFIWLHFMDAHAPYCPQHEALTQMGVGLAERRVGYLNLWWNRSDLNASSLSAHRDDIVHLYDAGIRSVDSQVQQLVNRLRALRVWDNCVFTLTADHGEEFLDHGGRYHKTSSLAEELIHVPLLMRVPGRSGRTETAPFSLLNLAPTLLHSLGIDAPGNFNGHSYWSQEFDRDSVVISECVAGCNNPWHTNDRISPRLLSLRQGRYKLVLDFRNSSERLFDLERDSRELHPLPREHSKPIRCRLLEEARKHIAVSSRSNSELRIAARLHELQLRPNLPRTADEDAVPKALAAASV